jgi:signal transduction histidine kinase
MEIILVIIIILLIVMISYQFKKKREHSAQLTYISEKLHSIIDNRSSEQLLVITDDQELKAILRALNELLSHNRQIIANYNKTEESMRKMLSNISHDIKTPLTVILGYTEMLAMEKKINDEERKELIQKVHVKTNEVLKLLNEFFDLAKLEAGDQDIPLTRVNINEICRKTILSFYDVLTAKGFEVEIDIPKTNVYVLGNEEVLGRVLNNLISNGITYGREGKVIGITLKCDNEWVTVDIWDKGKGINEYHLDKVFERMYTLEDSRNKLYQGSGLGLTITKRLVEKLGGNIDLSSKPYEKTVFSFTLKRIMY